MFTAVNHVEDHFFVTIVLYKIIFVVVYLNNKLYKIHKSVLSLLYSVTVIFSNDIF